MKRFFRSDASMIIFAALLIALSAWLSVSLSDNTKSYAARDREAKEESIYKRGYDAGYEDGYVHGCDEGYESGYDEGNFDGYCDGYNEGYGELLYAEDDAVSHARQYSEWHPEEAAEVIESYQNRTGDYTESEYRDAIESLYHFFEYYYYHLYE